ncbi:roadblock/LC7 domain-containing protein [Nonomuraea sp. SYSU D8015]|uniref:roadblock/LC7 domain-containing protein n=1 Tax=Nonomuraea sp. SYSU D8015 TaxID=2593644 RepID=UPI001660081B|nr:roadblock/LC7 domain-containing protein [Nonomuraea sp. SYSU D8015]
MTMQPTADTTDVTWVLDQLVKEQPGVAHALLFTTDGLVLAYSHTLQRAAAERAAAAMSAVKSLHTELTAFCSVPTGQETSPSLRCVISDMKDATLLLFAVNPRTGIGVSVEGDSMSRQVSAAITATLKMINGLRPVLDARERSDPA